MNLDAAGSYEPVVAPAPRLGSMVDGAAVSWSGTPHINVATPVDVQIARGDGRPVALERHLGAYGHLVLIREDDLGYLHFHASTLHATNETVGTLRFYPYAPSLGRYRAYVDFRLDGAVRTAEFTVEVR